MPDQPSEPDPASLDAPEPESPDTGYWQPSPELPGFLTAKPWKHTW